MRKYSFSFIVIVLFAAISCQDKPSVSPDDEVKGAFLAMYDFFNNEDLTDSLTYRQIESFYADDFVFLGDKGSAPYGKDAILGSWESMFMNLKPNFEITIDRLEVSGNLAYVLYHYHEVFTSLETSEKVIDVMHSAIMVLKKDAENNWKCSVLKWT